MTIVDLLVWAILDPAAGAILLAMGVGAVCGLLVDYLGFPKAAPFVAAITFLLASAGLLMRILLRKNRNRN